MAQAAFILFCVLVVATVIGSARYDDHDRPRSPQQRSHVRLVPGTSSMTDESETA